MINRGRVLSAPLRMLNSCGLVGWPSLDDICVYVHAPEGKEAMLQPDLGFIILGKNAVGCIGGLGHADKVLCMAGQTHTT